MYHNISEINLDINENKSKYITTIFKTYSIFIFITILILCMKLIIDQTIYTICESRYFYSETNLLGTWNALGHFFQGLFFPIITCNIMLLNFHYLKEIYRYCLLVIGICCGIGYHIYNFVKRYVKDYLQYDNFRDSSYFLNTWDWFFGFLIGTLMTSIILLIEYYKYDITIYYLLQTKKTKFLNYYKKSLQIIVCIFLIIYIFDIILVCKSHHFYDNCECPEYLRLPNCTNV